MPEPVVEIPNRPAFRASEVCEIAQIPPYVLKSWEKEFPGLGVATKPGGPRVYRRADVEQVMLIKHLLFSEGLTLAGARRKLEGEPKREEEPLPELPFAPEVRDKVARIKQDLRSLLDLLSGPPDRRQERGDRAHAGPEPKQAGQQRAKPEQAETEPSSFALAPEAEAAADAASEAADAASAAQPPWPPLRRADPGTGEGEKGAESLPSLGEAEQGTAPAKASRRSRKSSTPARASH